MTRRFTLRTIGVFAALLLASCIGDSTGPSEKRPGFINILPDFSVRGIHSVDVNRVLIRFTKPNSAAVVYDTLVPFPAADDTLDLFINVPINGASEQFLMTILMIDDPAGDTVFQAGPQLITATAGAPGAPTPVSFTYVGTGSKAAGVRFLVTPGSVLFGDTVVFTAEAFDSNNVTIPNTPIVWTSSDTTRAKIPNDSVGRVVGGIARGPVTITAALLTPPLATRPLLIQPKPNTVVVQGGSGQTGGVGSPLAQPVTVRVNALDNLGVAGVIVNFAVVAGGGTLSQLTDTTDVNGDASVIWTLGAALGAQSVSATVPGVTGGSVSVPATGVVGTPKQLAFVVQPTNVAAGVAIAPAVTVAARDTFGNTVASFTGNITLAIGANPGGSTLGGTTTVAAVAGEATFSTLTLNNLGTGYTLTASSGSLTAATSAAFSVAGGIPTQLVIVQQPTNTTGGTAITPAITVQLRDALNNLVPGATNTVTVAIGANPATGVLSGTQSVPAVGGVATFSTLNINNSGVGYTLVFSSTGLTAATSAIFDITAGPPTVLTFTTQPPSSAIFQSPFVTVVAARDAGGNVATSYTGAVTLGIGTNPAGGSLFGTTTVNAVAGVATFSGVSVDNIGAGYTLTANATGLAGTASGGMNVVAPANGNAWINAAGGNWSTAANWSKGTIPNATDTIFIRQSGTYTVNLDVGATVARLDVGAPIGVQTLNVATNTLTMAGNGAFTTSGNLVVSGSGTLSGAGTLDVFGAVTWSGGNLSVGGGTLRAHNTLTVSGSASGRQLNAYTLEVGGTGTWATTTSGMSSGGGGTVRVLSGGQLDVTGDFGLLFNQGGASSRLVVQAGGTLRRTTPGVPVQFTTVLDDSGSVQVLAGTLQLDGGGTSNGSFSAAAGATLQFGGTHTLQAASSVTGAGTVRVSSGTTNVAGSWTVGGTTHVAAGTLNVNTAAATTANLDVSNGTLGGTAGGLLTVSGAMTWSAGNLTGSGGIVRSTGTVAVSGNGVGRQLNGYTLEVGGTGSWATTVGAMSSGGAGTVRVLSGGQFDVTGDFGLLFNQGGAASRLAVQSGGTLRRTISAGAAQFTTVTDDSGSVQVLSGTLQLDGGGTSNGSFDAAAGTVLQFSGNHLLQATSTVTGTGTVRVAGGTTNAGGSWAHGGTTQVTGGTLNYGATGGSTVNLDVSNGTLGGLAGGLLTVSGAMTWSGGNFTGGGGIVRSTGTVAVSGSGIGRQINGYTLEVGGTGTWATTVGNMSSGGGGTVRVLTGGQFDVTGDFGLLFNQGGAPSQIAVQAGGNLRRTTSAGAVQFSTPVHDSGTVTVNTGTLQLDGGGASTGTYVTNGTATLSFGGGTHNLSAASVFNGAGTSFVQIPGGTLNASGSWVQSGTTRVNGGTANFNGPAMSTSALDVTAGTLGGSAGGLLDVGPSAMTWTGGNLSGAGGTTRISGVGSLNISGTAGRTFNNYVLEVGSTGGIWTGTHTIGSGAGAVLRVLPGGLLDIRGDATFTFNQGGAATLFDNQGTVVRSLSTGTATIDVNFVSTGVISMSSGVLNLTAGGAHSGTVGVNGATTFLDYVGGTFTLNNGYNETGSGVVRVQGAILVNSTVADTARFQNLDLNLGSLSHIGGVVVSGGPSTFNWTGGTINGTGTLRLSNTTATNVTGANARTFTNGTILNQGTTNWSGTHTISSGLGAVWRNAAVASFTLSGDGALTQNQGGVQTVFDNLGTFTRNTSAGTATWSARFTHTGGAAAMSVTTGVFNLTGGGLMSNGFTVTSPGFLDLSAGTFTMNTGVNVTGSGAVRLQGGTIVNSTVADTARFTNFTLSTGSLNQIGGVVVSSAFDWNNGASITGTGTTKLLNSGTMTVTGASARTFTNGVLLNQGTTNWSGSFTLSTGLGAIWRNAASATFILSGDGNFTLNQGGAATFDNVAGGFTRNTSAGTATWTAAFNHASGVAMAINTGTLSLNGGGLQTGPVTVATGAFLDYGAGTFTLNNGLNITGLGSARVQNATIVNSTVADTARFQNLVLNGGNVNQIGGVVVAGTPSLVDWAGGNLIGTGTFRVANTMNITGAGARTFTNGILLNQGATTWSGTHTISTGLGAIWRNAGGGTVTITGDGTLALNQGGTSTFDNLGTLARSTSAGVAVIDATLSKTGPINVTSGTLRFTGGSVTALTGLATASTGVLDFSAGNYAQTGPVDVTGSLLLSGTTIWTPSGFRLTTTANFTTSANGTIQMTNVADSLDINGNAIFGGGNGTLNAGVIRLAGNFTQTGTTSFRGLAQSAAVAHRVVIDGVVGTQTISFADPVNSFFRRLWVGKGGGTSCVFGTDVRTTYFALLGGTFSCTGVNAPPITRLIADTVAGNPSGSVSLQSPLVLVVNAANLQDSNVINVDTVVFAGNAQTIRTTVPSGGAGTYTFHSIRVSQATGTALVGQALNLTNDLNVTAGTLDLNGFHVGVTGAFSTQNTGALRMVAANDSLGVGGGVLFAGNSTTGLMTNGIIEVKGSFTQAGATTAFAPSGTHRTRFNLPGSGVIQQISFANPTTSFFDSLDLNRGSGVRGTVNFQTDTRINRGLSIQNGTDATGPTARISIVGGSLTASQSTFSPTLLTTRALELAVTPPALANMIGLVNINPDTVVFNTGIATLPVASGVHYKSIRVNTGATFVMSADTIAADVDVASGNASFPNTFFINGKLRTRGTATIAMPVGGAPNVTVVDSAIFGGGSTAGLLTTGTLRIKGHFSNTTAAGFQASGSHITEFNGPVSVAAAAIQNVTMTSPGTAAGNSRFNRLALQRSDLGASLEVMINLLSNVQAGNLVDTSQGRFDSIVGTGAVTLTTDSMQLNATLFNNVPLVVTNTGFGHSANTVRFENMNPVTTYLSLTRTNTSTSLTFSNFNFFTVRTGAGRYLNVTTTGANATGAFVSFLTSTTGGTFLAANNDYTRAFSGASTQLPTINFNGTNNP